MDVDSIERIISGGNAIAQFRNVSINTPFVLGASAYLRSNSDNYNAYSLSTGEGIILPADAPVMVNLILSATNACVECILSTLQEMGVNIPDDVVHDFGCRLSDISFTRYTNISEDADGEYVREVNTEFFMNIGHAVSDLLEVDWSQECSISFQSSFASRVDAHPVLRSLLSASGA